MPDHVSAPSTLLLLLFRPLALVRADSHTDIRYYQADAGVRCESDGYADILTNAGCEAAANNLSLSDTTVCGTCPVTNNNDFPNGYATLPSQPARVPFFALASTSDPDAVSMSAGAMSLASTAAAGCSRR